MIEKTGTSIKDAIPIKNSDEFYEWIEKNIGECGKDWQYPPDFNWNIYSNHTNKKKPIYIGELEVVLSNGIRKTIYFDARQYLKTKNKLRKR